MKQTIVIVLDSVGIGEAPDADAFGDVGSDTLGHIDAHCAAQGGLKLPNLGALGLGNIPRTSALTGTPAADAPTGAFGRLQEVAIGKDTATGHWEFMGLVLNEPLTTFPEGFPDSLIEALCARIGVDRVLGNVAVSGTKIIAELGEEHMRTGAPIIYTSADPVLQIAAHEDVVPIETLYAWCEAAYELAIPLGLSRIIARPFVGTPGAFERTHRRRDFALSPPEPTILDELADAGVRTLGVGKIASIFSGSGIHGDVHTVDNADGIAKTIAAMRADEFDFVFTNLVDFDSEYGHRRDPSGYAACLRAFDEALPQILAAAGPDDLILITADHGNDPTYPGTDHTREYVPILAYGRGATPGTALGTRPTFADLGQTVAASLGVATRNPRGTSMLTF